jgi:hypothetical protein
MLLYEFHSRCWRIRALTRNAAGLHLPAAYAPWDAQNGGKSLIEVDREDALYSVLERQGFFLTSLGMRVKG